MPHTFTAKVGTTEFTKDGAAQPLDVAIYTKNGYTMLPLRTFMQALDADAELVWEDGIQLAKVTMQDYTLSFDITASGETAACCLRLGRWRSRTAEFLSPCAIGRAC